MNQQAIYQKQTIEFVTVAKEFCAFIEGIQGMEKEEFVDKSRKLLPLLYLKASLVPQVEFLLEEPTERYVTEELYEFIRTHIAAIMGESDTFLEVFTQDMQYSENPIQEDVSEGMSDIYQDLRDFLYVFSLGFDETMHDALAQVVDSFQSYWGQKLLNVLRQLHTVAFSGDDDFSDPYASQEPREQRNRLFDNQKDHFSQEEEDEWNRWG